MEIHTYIPAEPAYTNFPYYGNMIKGVRGFHTTSLRDSRRAGPYLWVQQVARRISFKRLWMALNNSPVEFIVSKYSVGHVVAPVTRVNWGLFGMICLSHEGPPPQGVARSDMASSTRRRPTLRLHRKNPPRCECPAGRRPAGEAMNRGLFGICRRRVVKVMWVSIKGVTFSPFVKRISILKGWESSERRQRFVVSTILLAKRRQGTYQIHLKP